MTLAQHLTYNLSEYPSCSVKLRLGMMGGVILVLSLFTGCSRPHTPELRVVRQPVFEGETQEQTDLKMLAHDLEQHIKSDPEIAEYDVDINVSNSVTTLKGEVRSESERQRIEEIALFLAPDKKVINAVKIRKPVQDEELASRVQAALQSASQLPSSEILVVARQGTVELIGSVPRERDRDRALSITLDTPGVEEVVSRLTIAGMRGSSTQLD
jgi:osmotically-inducible protein OsmY